MLWKKLFLVLQRTFQGLVLQRTIFLRHLKNLAKLLFVEWKICMEKFKVLHGAINASKTFINVM